MLQDLSGPKIRTGRLKGGGPVELRDGARIVITTDETIEGTRGAHLHHLRPAAPRRRAGRPASCSTTATSSCASLRRPAQEVECEVVHGGLLKPNKGMNLPGVKLSTPALTEKDRARPRLRRSQNGVDYVALSFVRQAADVEECKALIRSAGRRRRP